MSYEILLRVVFGKENIAMAAGVLSNVDKFDSMHQAVKLGVTQLCYARGYHIPYFVSFNA
jgi:hypothetical protein